MSPMRRHPFHLAAIAAVLLVLSSSVKANDRDIERLLGDQYKNKVLVLRGFYSGDHLRYDSAGSMTGQAVAGDWTADGFVRVTDVRVARNRLIIKASRLAVAAMANGFLLVPRATRQPKGKIPILIVDADLGPGNSADTAQAAIAKIFLTPQDSLQQLAPDFWKPCLMQAQASKDGPAVFRLSWLRFREWFHRTAEIPRLRQPWQPLRTRQSTSSITK